MKLKPKSTVHNPRALLYKRFTDIEASFGLNVVYKTLVDNKLWLFSIEERRFIEYVGETTATPISVTTSSTNATVLKYRTYLFTYRAAGDNTYAWEEVTATKSATTITANVTVNPSVYAGQNILRGETLSAQGYLMRSPFPSSITITASEPISKFSIYVFNERGQYAAYRIDPNDPSYYEDIPADTQVSVSLYDVDDATSVFGTVPPNLIRADVLGFNDIESATITVELPVMDLDTLAGRFSDIGHYQTNKYYFAGSFDYMIRGSIGSSDSQPIKGNIMHLRSFEIKYFDDNINIDHDDLVVIDGHLYGVEELAYDIKRSPKPYTVYFATLNNIK